MHELVLPDAARCRSKRYLCRKMSLGAHKYQTYATKGCWIEVFLERVFWNVASTLSQYFVLPKNGSKYYLKYKFLAFPVLGILGLCTPLVPEL